MRNLSCMDYHNLWPIMKHYDELLSIIVRSCYCTCCYVTSRRPLTSLKSNRDELVVSIQKTNSDCEHRAHRIFMHLWWTDLVVIFLCYSLSDSILIGFLIKWLRPKPKFPLIDGTISWEECATFDGIECCFTTWVSVIDLFTTVMNIRNTLGLCFRISCSIAWLVGLHSILATTS